eukprot:74326-Amphidinium_carterae.1
MGRVESSSALLHQDRVNSFDLTSDLDNLSYMLETSIGKMTRSVEEVLTQRIVQNDLIEDSSSVPATASRTNLGKDKRVKSLLLGLYTRRGIGITRKTRNFPLLHELHELAKTCEIPPLYTSITINVMTDECVREHRDMNNVGESTAYVCGSFTGGALRQGSERVHVKQGWCKFQGQIPHEVEHVHGTRTSIVLSKQAPLLLTHVTGKRRVQASRARIWCDSEGMKNKFVLVEYACFEDSLLSVAFELAGEYAVRLGLPETDLTSDTGKQMFQEVIRTATRVARGTVVWFSIPCSFGQDWLGERQLKALPLAHAAIEVARLSASLGAQVVWEWPHQLFAWKLPEIVDLVSDLQCSTRIDACVYGFEYKGMLKDTCTQCLLRRVDRSQ